MVAKRKGISRLVQKETSTLEGVPLSFYPKVVCRQRIILKILSVNVHILLIYKIFLFPLAHFFIVNLSFTFKTA